MPDNIKLIVSFTRGENDAEELYNNFPHDEKDERVQLAEVKPFKKPEDRRELVQAYLSQYLKELDNNHIETLIKSHSAHNPLYLKVMLSELRVFGDFDSLGEKIRTDFGDTPLSAFEGVLRRLEHDPAYSPIEPKEAVPLIFGLLAHARNGLSGEELTSLLIQALDNKKRMEDASDTVHFFLSQVRHFLARRDGRYDFFYESFKNAALKRYVSEEDESQWTTQGWNKILADYFYGLPLWGKSKSKEEDKPEHYNLPNHRKVSELPYHQAHAMLWDELEHTLTDLDFLEAKVWAVGPQLLIDDYEESYQAGYKGESLRLYQKALRHEANILSQRPDLVWQQLYNRLQWAVKDKEDGLVARSIDKEYKIRSSKGALPWVHQINKVVESETLTRTLVGHTSEVNCCAFSPTDGKYIVSGSSDGMRLWETATGKEMATLKGHQSEILSCCFSPNGKLIVSGGSDGTLRLWEMTPFKELTVLEGSFGPVYCCAFSPTDGKYIVSGSSDGILRLWETATGKEMTTLKGHQREGFYGEVLSCAFSPNGVLVISGSLDDTLIVWDVATGKETQVLEGHTGWINTCSFSPDGTLIISGSADETIKLWDVTRVEETLTNKGHESGVVDCAFSPDGKIICSVGLAGAIKLWNADTGKVVFTLQGRLESCCAFSPDGEMIVSGRGNGDIVLWDIATQSELATWKGHLGPVYSCAFSPDGKTIVSGSADKTLRLWDIATQSELATWRGHNGFVLCCAFSPDGSRVASASFDKTTRIWDVRTAKEPITLKGHTREVRSCAFSPCGRFIVSGGWDKFLRIWEVATEKEFAVFPALGNLLGCDFGSRDNLICVGDEAKNLYIVRLIGV